MDIKNWSWDLLDGMSLLSWWNIEIIHIIMMTAVAAAAMTVGKKLTTAQTAQRKPSEQKDQPATTDALINKIALPPNGA